MNDIEKILPQKIKNKQYLVAGIMGLAAIGLVSAWVLLGKKPTISINLEKTKRIEISKLTNGVKAESMWLQQAEGQLKALKKQVEVQEQEKNSLKQDITEIQEEMQRKGEDESNLTHDSVLAEEIMKLREEIELLKNHKPSQPEQMQGIRKIKSTELKLDGGKANSFNLEHYIPAGSFAPAVVTSGVDASVGVNSQGDPRPTLFRITGLAKSAANAGQVQNIDLTGCTVTGAASGDLSSERVFIRLLKMACSRENGQVTETQVQGYVAGIGKAGVRGQVVSREGDFVMKSFLAGVASGLGSGAAQSFTTPTSIFGATQKPEVKDIFGSGVGKGVENSGNKVSSYLIQRAEQYQPVISIPAGLDVELVFTDGVYLDGKPRITEDRSPNVQN
jgi:conjugal transfer pilus assembly protein TraB